MCCVRHCGRDLPLKADDWMNGSNLGYNVSCGVGSAIRETITVVRGLGP